jgi:hypothetical protein
MAEWSAKLDAFLTFNDRAVLTHAGKLSRDAAQSLAEERYERFDMNRRKVEASQADAEDLAAIEALGKVVAPRKKGGE